MVQPDRYAPNNLIGDMKFLQQNKLSHRDNQFQILAQSREGARFRLGGCLKGTLENPRKSVPTRNKPLLEVETSELASKVLRIDLI